MKVRHRERQFMQTTGASPVVNVNTGQAAPSALPRHRAVFKCTRALAKILPLLGLASAALPLSANPLDDKFSLDVGTFLVTTNTKVRVDGSSGMLGTSFNVEDTLGLTSQYSFRVDGYWRFAKRHKVRAEYFSTNRSSTKTLDRDINFGDETYPVNSQLTGWLDEKIYGLAYEYAFAKGEHYEVCGVLGLGDLSFDLKVAGYANNLMVQKEASGSANAPVPAIGFDWTWQMAGSHFLEVGGQYFQYSISGYNGNIQNYTVHYIFQPWKNVGLGFGWNTFITAVNVESTHFNGRLQYQYGGLQVFVKVAM